MLGPDYSADHMFFQRLARQIPIQYYPYGSFTLDLKNDKTALQQINTESIPGGNIAPASGLKLLLPLFQGVLPPKPTWNLRRRA